MIRSTIVDGPSKRELRRMLVMFEEQPDGAIDHRELHFKLKCGFEFDARIHSLTMPDDRAVYEEERRLWNLWGSCTTFPAGYNYGQSGSLEIRFNPKMPKGYVDLEITCPNCGHDEFRPDDTAAKQFMCCTNCRQGVHILGDELSNF